MNARAWVAGTAIAVLIGGATVAGLTLFSPVPVTERCTVNIDGAQAYLAVDQAMNAATISAIATKRELPIEAVTIALATALQESKLRNLDYGDRDSLGLFQQRPFQGWGTEEQVQDPIFATNAFFDALVEIEDYTELPVTEAAQKVQRSGYPSAYAEHEDEAALWAVGLSGEDPRAVSCRIRPDAVAAQPTNDKGLTSRAQTTLTDMRRSFGKNLEVNGFSASGVSSGHIEGSAHYDGRALDVFPDTRTQGWAIAMWAVTHAERLGIATVIYDDHIWTARRSGQGWRDYVHPSGNTTDPTLRHLDHVHIDVQAGN